METLLPFGVLKSFYSLENAAFFFFGGGKMEDSTIFFVQDLICKVLISAIILWANIFRCRVCYSKTSVVPMILAHVMNTHIDMIVINVCLYVQRLIVIDQSQPDGL